MGQDAMEVVHRKVQAIWNDEIRLRIAACIHGKLRMQMQLQFVNISKTIFSRTTRFVGLTVRRFYQLSKRCKKKRRR